LQPNTSHCTSLRDEQLVTLEEPKMNAQEQLTHALLFVSSRSRCPDQPGVLNEQFASTVFSEG
jgi:hypothetical protein